MKKFLLLTLTTLQLATFNATSQCTTLGGFTSQGTLTPTTAYQTVVTQGGRYFSVNVTACRDYEFTFCNDGGTASFDTEITVLAPNGTSIAYNDDNCSLQSRIVFTSSFTGTIRVVITKFNCVSEPTNATLAYRYTNHSNTLSGYCMHNSANSQTIGGNNCVQLTPETSSLTGCAWNSTPINFAQNFSLALDYYFGDNINGADGTTFTFTPYPTGCGQNGGQLGAGGIPNALVIEFDTYDNDNPTHAYDMLADHIAVVTNSNLQSPPLCGPVTALPSGTNIDNGVTHRVRIDWNATSQTLSIYLDNNLRLTCNHNFVTNVFGGVSTIYWGATAATGTLNNQQYFCPITVVLPVELSQFYSECDGERNALKWTSASEHRLDYYKIEYTLDGYVYYTLGTVDAVGESNTTQYYQLTDPAKHTSEVYYRLVSVDMDGATKTSDLILGQNCVAEETNQLISSIYCKEGNVQLQCSKPDVLFEVFDLNGKNVIQQQNCIKKVTFPLEKGVYLLKAWEINGKQMETHRFVVM